MSTESLTKIFEQCDSAEQKTLSLNPIISTTYVLSYDVLIIMWSNIRSSSVMSIVAIAGSTMTSVEFIVSFIVNSLNSFSNTLSSVSVITTSNETVLGENVMSSSILE